MRRALVVDDEPLLRHQVAEIVAGYGFDEILEAENGVQAVEIAAHKEILLVVMDVGMPVMDGATAAEKLARSSPCRSFWLRQTLRLRRLNGRVWPES